MKIMVSGNRKSLIDTFRILSKDYIILNWWNKKLNFGDDLSRSLTRAVSGKNVVHRHSIINWCKKPVYSVIGSILKGSDENLVVWGAGFMNQSHSFEVRPRQICAVRGPLTRDHIHSMGIECPEVYGDPAILTPQYFNYKRDVVYEYGIVPHFYDLNNPVNETLRNQGVLVIDVRRKFHDVIRDILSCKQIASSSLHGLIIADSYSVPNVWISYGKKTDSECFKYWDYYTSVEGNRGLERRCVPAGDLVNRNNFDVLTGVLDNSGLADRLIEACPFSKN